MGLTASPKQSGKQTTESAEASRKLSRQLSRVFKASASQAHQASLLLAKLEHTKGAVAARSARAARAKGYLQNGVVLKASQARHITKSREDKKIADAEATLARYEKKRKQDTKKIIQEQNKAVDMILRQEKKEQQDIDKFLKDIEKAEKTQARARRQWEDEEEKALKQQERDEAKAYKKIDKALKQMSQVHKPRGRRRNLASGSPAPSQAP